MDLGQIGIGAFYGAVGGAAGALLGSLLAFPFRSSKAGPTITTIFAVAGVILGMNFARPILSPHVGQFIGDTPEARSARVENEIVAAVAESRADPLMAALHDREPNFEQEFRDLMRDILESGVQPVEARRRAYEWGYDQTGGRLNYYLQRARDADIVSFFEVMTELIGHLAASVPEFCHAWLYDPRAMANVDRDALIAKFGAELYRRQQSAAAAVVRNAFDEIPEYDEAVAQLRVEAVGRNLYADLGDEKIGLISAGQKPANGQEARAACKATGKMYRALLDGDGAASALRHVMVLGAA